MSKIIRNTLLALATSALTLGASQAAPMNYTFVGKTDAGSTHANMDFSGTFSFDTASLVPDALTSLVFSYLGTHYTLANADAGSAFVDYDGLGGVVGFDAGFTLASGSLTFSSVISSPSLIYSTLIPFAYDGGDFTVAAVSSVPEPTMLALSLAGLGAAGLATTRRRRQASAAV